jgi:hypothetical protein
MLLMHAAGRSPRSDHECRDKRARPEEDRSEREEPEAMSATTSEESWNEEKRKQGDEEQRLRRADSHRRRVPADWCAECRFKAEAEAGVR